MGGAGQNLPCAGAGTVSLARLPPLSALGRTAAGSSIRRRFYFLTARRKAHGGLYEVFCYH
ncbi:hypothetical protein BACCAP_03616 [Pseudoflavonifractor capillosus ATCC 29799]|uniref:Uncharacterized protein n=1 Tax=Pseudoflavonifractor capillosus ATCC 29799 TaxID=411467 RepID=A6NZG5_9FIRM|nr:hypothetical protein BACCAP_03616 [Pseudoflavonifractor capillosus ATCC 29799]